MPNEDLKMEKSPELEIFNTEAEVREAWAKELAEPEMSFEDCVVGSPKAVESYINRIQEPGEEKSQGHFIQEGKTRAAMSFEYLQGKRTAANLIFTTPYSYNEATNIPEQEIQKYAETEAGYWKFLFDRINTKYQKLLEDLQNKNIVEREIGIETVAGVEAELIKTDEEAIAKAEALGGEEAKSELGGKLDPGEKEAAGVLANVEKNEYIPIEPETLGKAINALFEFGIWCDRAKLLQVLNIQGKQPERIKRIEAIEQKLVELGVISLKTMPGKNEKGEERIIKQNYNLLITNKEKLTAELSSLDEDSKNKILNEIKIEKAETASEKIDRENMESRYIPKSRENVQEYYKKRKRESAPCVVTKRELVGILYRGISGETQEKIIEKLIEEGLIKKLEDGGYEILAGETNNVTPKIKTQKEQKIVEIEKTPLQEEAENFAGIVSYLLEGSSLEDVINDLSEENKKFLQSLIEKDFIVKVNNRYSLTDFETIFNELDRLILELEKETENNSRNKTIRQLKKTKRAALDKMDNEVFSTTREGVSSTPVVEKTANDEPEVAPTPEQTKTSQEMEIAFQKALRADTVEVFEKFIAENPNAGNLITRANQKIEELKKKAEESTNFEQAKEALLKAVEEAQTEWAKLVKEKLKGDEGKEKLENAKKAWDQAKKEYVKFLLEKDPTNGKVLAQEFLFSQVEFKRNTEKTGWGKFTDGILKFSDGYDKWGVEQKNKKGEIIKKGNWFKRATKGLINTALISGITLSLHKGATVSAITQRMLVGLGVSELIGAVSKKTSSKVIVVLVGAGVMAGITMATGGTAVAALLAGGTSLGGAAIGQGVKKILNFVPELAAKQGKESLDSLKDKNFDISNLESSVAKLEKEYREILTEQKRARILSLLAKTTNAAITPLLITVSGDILNNNLPENTEDIDKSEETEKERTNVSPRTFVKNDTLIDNDATPEVPTETQSNTIEEDKENPRNGSEDNVSESDFTSSKTVKEGDGGVSQTLKNIYDQKHSETLQGGYPAVPQWFKDELGPNPTTEDWATFVKKIGAYDPEAKLDSLVIRPGDTIGFDNNDNLILRRDGENFILAKPDESGGFVKGDWEEKMQNEKFMDTDKYPNTGSTIERIDSDEITEPGSIEKLDYLDEDDAKYQGEGYKYLDREDSGYDRNEESQEFDNMNLKEFFAIGKENMSAEEVQKAEELRELFNQAQAVDPDTKEWIRSHTELSIKDAEEIYKEIIAGKFDAPSQNQPESIGMTQTEMQQQVEELTKQKHNEIVNDIFTKNRMFGKDIPGLESESWNEIKNTKINDLFKTYANDPRELDKDQREFVETLHKINNNRTTPGAENETVNEYLNRKLNDKSEEIVKQRNINTQNLKFGN